MSKQYCVLLLTFETKKQFEKNLGKIQPVPEMT